MKCFTYMKLFIVLSIVTMSSVMGESFKSRTMSHMNDEVVDVDRKKNETKQFVEDAVDFFQKKPLAEACRSFNQDSRWYKGELYIYIFDENGVCYVHGANPDAIWRNLKDLQRERSADEVVDLTGSLIDQMLETGKKGDWLIYDWNFRAKYAYVKNVKRGGKNFVIGAGFYPESDQFAITELVKRAVRYANNNSAQALFSRINNPYGVFVKGDLYLWAYDFEGNAYAHGRNLAMVGQNRLEWQDADGRYRNKIIVDKLKDQQSLWIEYSEKGDILKRGYVEKFTDPQTGKQYFVGGGYYPNLDADMIKSFVKRGVDYLKENGATEAQQAFTSHTSQFIQGPLRLFMYNMQGVMLADAENPEFIGQDLSNTRDAEGKYITKSILAKAKNNGSGWVSILDKGEYKEIYVEKVVVPDGEYVVGAGFWPASKGHSTMALVNKAVDHLENNTIQDAFADFSKISSEFLRGDLFVSVYDQSGITLAYGPYKRFVWDENKKPLSKKGYPVVDHLIATARAGGGWYTYNINGLHYRTFVREVVKEDGTHGHGLGKNRNHSKNQKNATSSAASRESRYTVAVGYYLD